MGQQLGEDLGEMTVALRGMDKDVMKAAGKRLSEGLPCVKTPVPTQVMASTYRYIGAYHFLVEDRASAAEWFRSGLELDPTYEWDINDLPQGHPMRQAFDAERAASIEPPVALDGVELNPPAGSNLYLDGRNLRAPEATLDRPHLLQVISTTDRSVRQVYLIRGNAIPTQFVRPTGSATEAVASTDETETAYGQYKVQRIERLRPPAKTPMMVGGLLGVIASGGIYAATFGTQQKFLQANTTEDLERYRSLTNTLVIASGATLAIGVGVGYSGIQLDGAGLRWSGQL